MDAKQKSVLYAILLTIGLFLSRIFIIITPLPVIYYLLKNKGKSFFSFALPALSIVILVYALGLHTFYHLYKANSDLFWLLPMPALEFLDVFSPKIVMGLGIGYFGFYVFAGYIIYVALTYPKKTYQIILATVVGVFVLAAALFLLLEFSQLQATLIEIRGHLMTAIDQFIQMQEKADLNLEQLVALKDNRDSFVDYALYLIPVFSFGSIAFLFVLNLVLIKRFFVNAFNQLNEIKLTQFQIPFALVWGVIFLIGLLLVNFKLIHNEILHFTALNFLLAIGLVYFFQGFAVFIDFMQKRKINGFLRLFFYFIVLSFFQSAWVFFIVMGFFESWMDVRKLNVVVKTDFKV